MINQVYYENLRAMERMVQQSFCYTTVCIALKSRVKSEMFDCPANFNVVCLNTYLLQELDFTSSFVGVLLRFCSDERVVTQANIKATFHQT